MNRRYLWKVKRLRLSQVEVLEWDLPFQKKLQNLGVHVIVFDLQTPPENFEFYRVDISDDGQIKSALSHILRLDIIVNNAGVYFEKYLEDTTNEEINTMVDINIKGTYLVTRNAFEKK